MLRGSAARDATLVERDDELVALRDAIERRLTVLVTGAPGIGKTSLLEAACRGRETVLTAVCTPLGRGVPYSALRSMLARLARAVGPGHPPFDGPAETMQRIVHDESIEADSAHLAASLAWLLEQLEEAILVIDDAQWIDAASGRAIAAALHQVPRAALIAARPLEDDGWPLHGLAELTLQPAPLTIDGVRAVLEQLPSGERPAAEPAEVAAATGGIPLYVRAASLSSRAPSVGLRGREWAMRGLRGLPDAEREVITALAVLARPVPVKVLAGLVERDLARPLASLLAHELLAVEHGLWRLRVPLLAEAVLESLPAARAVHLHAEAARALVRVGAPRAEVAAHLAALPRLAEDWQQSLVADAAADALSAGDATTARSLALRLLGEQLAPELEPTVRFTAVRALLSQGAVEEAMALLDGDGSPSDPREIAEAGEVLLAAGAYHVAADRSRRGVASALAAGDRGLARRLLGSQAVAEFMASAVPRALAHPEALAVASQPPDADHEDDFALLAAHSLAAAFGASAEVAGALVDRALALATPTAGDASVFLLSGAANATSRHAEGAALLEGVVADAVDRRLLLDEATARYCLGAMVLPTGDVVRASVELELALRTVPLGWRHYREAASAFLAQAQIRTGRVSLARRTVARIPATSGVVEAMRLSALAEVALAEGDPLSGAALAERARVVWPHESMASIIGWRALAGAAALAIGDLERARRIAEDELAAGPGWHSTRRGLPAAQLRLARTMALPADRVAPLRAAIEEMPQQRRLHRAEAQLELSEALLELGHAAEPAVLAREVVALALPQGLRTMLRRARAVLAAVGSPIALHDADLRVATLSPAERRVADLAAQGWTNREVAAELYVSLKTVEFHLSRTYRKLHVATRRELAAALSHAGAGAGAPATAPDANSRD